jgi:hypothetical protein
MSLWWAGYPPRHYCRLHRHPESDNNTWQIRFGPMHDTGNPKLPLRTKRTPATASFTKTQPTPNQPRRQHTTACNDAAQAPRSRSSRDFDSLAGLPHTRRWWPKEQRAGGPAAGWLGYWDGARGTQSAPNCLARWPHK